MIETFALFDHIVQASVPRPTSAEISNISFDTDTRKAQFTVHMGQGNQRSETMIIPDDGTEREAFAGLNPELSEPAKRLMAMKIAVTAAVRDRVASMLRVHSALERI